MGSVWVDANSRLLAIEQYMKAEITNQSPLKGLTPKEINVLFELYQQDKRHASDIARHIGVVATSFTPVLDSLERHKLIARQADTSDRRGVFISLTTLGHGLKPMVCDMCIKTNKKFGKV